MSLCLYSLFLWWCWNTTWRQCGGCKLQFAASSSWAKRFRQDQKRWYSKVALESLLFDMSCLCNEYFWSLEEHGMGKSNIEVILGILIKLLIQLCPKFFHTEESSKIKPRKMERVLNYFSAGTLHLQCFLKTGLEEYCMWEVCITVKRCRARSGQKYSCSTWKSTANKNHRV